MNFLHPVFGELKLNEYEEYEAVKPIKFFGLEEKVKITFDDEVTEKHCEAYQSFVKNLDRITLDIIHSIIAYQNEHYEDTDHTESFKYFENADDVMENTKLFEVSLQSEFFGKVTKTESYREIMEESEDAENGRFVVLLFGAEWVNDDYGILSVALVNEKVVYVTEEKITL